MLLGFELNRSLVPVCVVCGVACGVRVVRECGVSSVHELVRVCGVSCVWLSVVPAKMITNAYFLSFSTVGNRFTMEEARSPEIPLRSTCSV